jgi:hypothetical protein
VTAVSVIMPAFNVEPYLGEAIDSVLAQTFRSFELVIADDGSSDGTWTVASEWHARYPSRITLVRQPNRGVSAARNAAMRVARGDVFALLDGDDMWDPEFLAAQMRLFEDRPEVDVVSGNGWYLGGPRHGQPAQPSPDWRPAPCLESILRDHEAVFIMSLFRRRVYERIGGYDEALRTNEDYDFWIRAAAAGSIFARNLTPLGWYRRRNDSLSADSVRMLRGILRVYDKSRALCPDGSPERAILEQQIARFRIEATAAEARQALERGEGRAAARHLADLATARGGAALRCAASAARIAPPAAIAAWRVRNIPRRARDSTVAVRSACRVPLRALQRLDRALSRHNQRRVVLVEARTPMNLVVLQPIYEALLADHRLEVRFTARDRPDLEGAFARAGLEQRVVSRRRATWLRTDLYINADPWDSVRLYRCRWRVNFFHGVAGKFDLDRPLARPMGLERYTRIAFPNPARLRNYVAMGLVTPEQAALVGFPKLDALVADPGSPREARVPLGLDPDRPTAIYAPTFSPCSSLQQSGERIVRALVDAGCNVIVKLHDRSLDPDPRYSGGVDWPTRFRRLEAPGRLLFARDPDSTPYLRASDVMVTDHSTVGFEFCTLDRPLIVYDTPDLLRGARINPAKWRLLRSAATVVRTPGELLRAVDAALANPAALSTARAHAAREVFHEPGRATARALALIYETLEMEPVSAAATAPPGALTRAGAA